VLVERQLRVRVEMPPPGDRVRDDRIDVDGREPIFEWASQRLLDDG